MTAIRRLALSLAALTLAVSASAQVTLGVSKDGKKVIYNLGPSGSGGKGSGDLHWLAKQHDRRSQYDAIIEKHSSRRGIDPVLAKAVIQVESSYNPRCVSRKGARGLMQLMPETARRFGVKDIFDPEQNIAAGIQYLSVLMDMFSGNLTKVLAAYNAGENAVIRYGGIPPYNETETYVARALSVYYGRPYGSGSMSYAGGKEPKLTGGFGRAAANPVGFLTGVSRAAGLKYLGTR
jgi:soluble lytic murein transglycosylase-like protein